MSDRTPEDYENALRAVLSITMDDLAGNTPFCSKCGRALSPSESYSDDRAMRVHYAPCDTCRSVPPNSLAAKGESDEPGRL